MSKKNRSRRRKDKTGRSSKHPRRSAQHQLKMSEIIKAMARLVLKDPATPPSEPATQAAFTIATAAWNAALGDTQMLDCCQELMQQIDWEDWTPWAELLSDDISALIDKLKVHKQQHYGDDRRKIIATEKTIEGNIRVHWTELETVVNADFTPPNPKATSAKRRRPIATKLLKKMNSLLQSKVVDLESVMVGKAMADELQQTVILPEELAEYHPAHALYIYAQNQLSVMSEQLLGLKEMQRFSKLISQAEDEYRAEGPPMSPLTRSFFTCWTCFDACVGLGQETLATTTMAVGSAFGMHQELVRLIGLMQDSKMAVYLHEGVEGDTVVLRELVTDTICRAIVPSGYLGHRGELWYVRVLPPPRPDGSLHVVFTTPYLLVMTGLQEWLRYFQRTLPDAPLQARMDRYQQHMKFGPTRDYWNEFVFEAYVNHRSDVIYLKGLPDIPESRPHSRVNSP